MSDFTLNSDSPPPAVLSGGGAECFLNRAIFSRSRISLLASISYSARTLERFLNSPKNSSGGLITGCSERVCYFFPAPTFRFTLPRGELSFDPAAPAAAPFPPPPGFKIALAFYRGRGVTLFFGNFFKCGCEASGSRSSNEKPINVLLICAFCSFYCVFWKFQFFFARDERSAVCTISPGVGLALLDRNRLFAKYPVSLFIDESTLRRPCVLSS